MKKSLQTRFENLQKNFKPDSCGVTLNPQGESTLEQVAESVASAVERLAAFVKNGHSTEGLPFSYAKVTIY